MSTDALQFAQRRAWRSTLPLWWSNLAAVYATRTPPDLVRARRWYRRAAVAGDLRGCFEYGLMLLRGEGGAAHPAAGRRLLERAAKGRDLDALKVVAHAYRTGTLGFPSSPRAARMYGAECDRVQRAMLLFSKAYAALEAGQPGRARRLFTQGAALRDAGCALGLGYLYDHALGGRRDVQQAESWYRRAHAWGETLCAPYNLGLLMAERGRMSLARRWLQRAASTGDRDAAAALKRLQSGRLPGAPRMCR